MNNKRRTPLEAAHALREGKALCDYGTPPKFLACVAVGVRHRQTGTFRLFDMTEKNPPYAYPTWLQVRRWLKKGIYR